MTNDPDKELLQPPNIEWNELYQSDPWRVLRIQSEFVRGFETLAEVTGAVTVFGSARIDESNPHYELARETGKMLSNEGFDVITGGGPGIMEAVNRGAQVGSSRSIGVNIQLPHEQSSNDYLDVDLKVEYFFVRKVLYVKYSRAYVIFPGGFGTLDELFEAITLIQTNKIQNFPIILVDEDYWTPLLDWIREQLLEMGAIEQEDLEVLTLTSEVAEIKQALPEPN